MAEFDNRTAQRLMTDIMELLVTHYGAELSEEELDYEMGRVEQALNDARTSHQGQVRKSGEPYIFHPLRVTHLAARHWMDFPSVIAALLHDVVEDTPVTLKEVRKKYGEEVAHLVDGLTKVTSEIMSRDDLKKETYKKTLLVAVNDIRVLCLKFWDRIDNLYTIDALPLHKQKLIAEETRMIYVPLAQHLGMGYVATELESLSYSLLYPKRAKSYQLMLHKVKKENRDLLRKIRAQINNSCEQQKLDVGMKERWRPFSIVAARAMSRGFSALFTLEVQVDRMMDAYLFLGILHSLYPPIPGKLRDHLNLTSQHGYQALKTSVQAAEQRMRVEITTRKLARFNESGVLAPGFKFRHENFRELMKSLMEGESAFDTESLKLASATIQVYTPQGEIRTLPEGSSVLDFAFDIHDSLGLHARRGLINGRTRQLKTRLLDGDQVVVETSDHPEVLPKWLEWAVTPRARNSIRRYLRNKVRAA
ncbi:MAG: HD domain-containing protein [Deltaproteobacteria bacterium]|jgi:GTP pyrophosphokinase|nr:HD domain-containing protein [Deltaproteobacteria bacterium]MCW9049199.1 HD domain-containing protein [Deltaproteobacteria bacterium]